jgi:type III restriction enzyme
VSEAFFEGPILNSPYAKPAQHWHLDDNGRPTGVVFDSRRR